MTSRCPSAQPRATEVCDIDDGECWSPRARSARSVGASALLWAAFLAAFLLASVVITLSSREALGDSPARPRLVRDLAGLFPWWLCDEGVLKGCDLPARAGSDLRI